MSRKNKVNPNHYKVAGRLSADDLARERMKQSAPNLSKDWEERSAPAAPRTAAPSPEAIDAADVDASASRRAPRSARASQSPKGTAKAPTSNRMAGTKKKAAGAKKTVARKGTRATAASKRTSAGRKKAAKKASARR